MNFTPSTDLCVKSEGLGNTFYNWTVRGCNNNVCGAWSNVWNFTIELWVVITLVNNSINLGNLNLSQIKDTTTFSPGPFVLQNDGNVVADMINVSSNQSLWSSPGAGLGTKYFQIKADNSSKAGSFNYSGSAHDWINVTNYNQTLISQLDYNDTKDQAYVHVRVEVPADESPGVKQSSIFFEFKQTP